MPRTKTLVQKINAVRRKVDYIQKDNKAGSGQPYASVSHDAVTAQVREALITNGLVITPPSVVRSNVADTNRVTNSGAPIIRYEADFLISITDGATDEFGNPSQISATIPAHAEDFGDKAPGKAMSYATKNFILKLFNIETGEDDESRIASAGQGQIIEVSEYAKLQDIIGKIKDAGGTFHEPEFIEYLKERGLEGKTLTEVTQGIYPIAVAALYKKLKVVTDGKDKPEAGAQS
jgi:hypothetical protein